MRPESHHEELQLNVTKYANSSAECYIGSLLDEELITNSLDIS